LGFAAPEQRKEYALDLFGLRWEALDEDLSYDGFFYDKMNKSSIHIQESGPGGIRTLVQTRNKFAFYMLIST